MRSMYKVSVFVLLVIVPFITVSFMKEPSERDQPALKEAFAGKFLIGTALNRKQIYEKGDKAQRVIKKHFNIMTAENCMKAMYLQPREGFFDFEEADRFVALGERYGMKIIGHTLIWHSQAPKWFFLDKKGNEVSKEVLIERMRTHIQTVVSRYKGRIKGWDVVNEAILDNGEWRKSKFYKIIGKDFVRLAFLFAQEADPEAELYYNDYSMSLKEKREGVIDMVTALQAENIKISGVGMQAHLTLSYPSLSDFEHSLLDFSNLGVQVMITEMDISVLPSPSDITGAEVNTDIKYNEKLNPYVKGLPAAVNAQLAARYKDFFKLFLKYQDRIDRVTLWGVGDGDSWKNNWPMRGRTDYPLLFDRVYHTKPFVNEIIRLAEIY